MIAFDEVPPADRDVAVNGPLWASHVIPTVEITTTEVAERRRVLAQASRRAKRNEADQALIDDLRRQLERAEHMAESKIIELANFHQGACDTAVRTKYVLHVTSLVSLLTQTSFHHTFCTVHTVHTVCSPSLL